MRGFSINGHNTEIVISTVDTAIITSVEKDGLRPVRRVCHAIQPQAPRTAKTERAVIHQCMRTNEDSSEPVLASTVAGNAKGSTQHAPQAIAPVASVTAVTPAAFVPGGSFAEVFTMVAHAHDICVGAPDTN